MTVRVRLTLWHSGLLALLVLAFAVASYTFLRGTELDRIDSTLHEQSEIVTQAMREASIGGDRKASADTARLLSALHDLRARSLRASVFDGAGHEIVSTAMVHEGEGDAEERLVLGDPLPPETLRNAVAATRTGAVTLTASGVRLFAAPLPSDLGPGTIVVSHSLRDLDELLARARNAAVLAVALALVLAALAGYVLARQSLAPVADMSRHADRIGGENLHERLPVANPHDELGTLAATFNGLLDRVAGAFDQQRRFMADASHELRTPVAIVRGEAEIALSADTRTREEYRDALLIVRDATDRLTRIVNDIFLLARVDARQVPTTPVELYLDEVVLETCRAMRSLAAPRSIELLCDAATDVRYSGDEKLLERLATNLIDNAIKYSYDGGVVRVQLTSSPAGVTLTVSNAGPGIPSDAKAHVFDRFFRADTARTHAIASQGSGSGLGLSIARWIAELHGGCLELTEASAATTVFTLRLPLEPILHTQR